MFYKAHRSWGSEYLLFCVPNFFTIKLLFVTKGRLGGLQYHRLKHEVGILLAGKLLVRKGTSNDGLEVEETIHFPFTMFEFKPLQIHQEQALENCWILEVSSPHFNDRVRFDCDVNKDNSLQSTSLEEILTIRSDDDLCLIGDFGFIPLEVSSAASILKRVLSKEPGA